MALSRTQTPANFEQNYSHKTILTFWPLVTLT